MIKAKFRKRTATTITMMMIIMMALQLLRHTLSDGYSNPHKRLFQWNKSSRTLR